jgi:hypothetical protein
VGIPISVTSIATVSAGGTVGDEGVLDPANFGSNFDAPGGWTTVAGVPDAGSTLSLMTLTLVALGLVARRFQRAAGSPLGVPPLGPLPTITTAARNYRCGANPHLAH